MSQIFLRKRPGNFSGEDEDGSGMVITETVVKKKGRPSAIPTAREPDTDVMNELQLMPLEVGDVMIPVMEPTKQNPTNNLSIVASSSSSSSSSSGIGTGDGNRNGSGSTGDEDGKNKRIYCWTDILNAFSLYKEKHFAGTAHAENWTVPVRFVIPNNTNEWPEAVWGLKLGRTAFNMKNRHTYSDHRAELEAMGMSFGIVRATKWEMTFAALQTYKQLHVIGTSQDVNKWCVPLRFVVPETADWPEHSWKSRLGQTVRDIRSKNYFKEHKDELLQLGLDFECRNTLESQWERNFLAFQRYRELEVQPQDREKWTIPQRFVVPDGSANWPESTWGLKLGWCASTIRLNDSFKENRTELESIGFDVMARRPIGSKSTKKVPGLLS